MATRDKSRKRTKKPPTGKRTAASAGASGASAKSSVKAAVAEQEPESVEAVTSSIQEMMAVTQRQIQKDLQVFGRELKRMQTHVTETAQRMHEAHSNALRQTLEQTRPPVGAPAGGAEEPEMSGPEWDLEDFVSSAATAEATVAGAERVDPGEVAAAPSAEQTALAAAAGRQAIEATAQAVENTRLAALGLQDHSLASSAETIADGQAREEASAVELPEVASPPEDALDEDDPVAYADSVVQEAVHPAELAVNAATGATGATGHGDSSL